MMLKIAVGLSALLLSISYASAQTFESNMNGFETPLGMNSVTSIDTPVSSSRDANFNRINVQKPGWSFSATTVGNLVNVQTNGNNNTIVVNANQVNKGNQTTNLSRVDQSPGSFSDGGSSSSASF
ncbi:MAG TPA: hypothetical protein VFX23_13340 [Limnobacter sp.]|uniref:hypothetical protein n=1 Tax=Limnobacter sp. TaxID=2003368 RepID=UPI002E332C96|nr:hypothetical protein [Limnobacter sp.]HEX5486970.1 hypothetical protein [Limnobacter sp.]